MAAAPAPPLPCSHYDCKAQVLRAGARCRPRRRRRRLGVVPCRHRPLIPAGHSAPRRRRLRALGRHGRRGRRVAVAAAGAGAGDHPAGARRARGGGGDGGGAADAVGCCGYGARRARAGRAGGGVLRLMEVARLARSVMVLARDLTRAQHSHLLLHSHPVVWGVLSGCFCGLPATHTAAAALCSPQQPPTGRGCGLRVAHTPRCGGGAEGDCGCLRRRWC